MGLKVLCWNVGNGRGLGALAQELEEEYDVLAISEPEFDTHQQPVCTRGSRYYAVYYGGRAALYVHKRWPATGWTQTGGVDWCAVTFKGVNPWTIYSVYSPNPGPEWASPLTELAEGPLEGRCLVVGDFNLHHPMWDREGRESRHCNTALTLVDRWDLELLTPWGTVTRRGKPGERDSTIDLAWSTPDLQAWHDGHNSVEGSDHVAQVIHIDDTATPHPLPSNGPAQYSWALINREWIAAEAAARIPYYTMLTDTNRIEQATSDLLSTLQTIAATTTPTRKPFSGRAAPWWNDSVRTAVGEARAEGRRYQENHSEAAWATLQEAIAAQRKAIREARTASWRGLVDKASNDPKVLWQLAKWGRLRSHQKREPLTMPDLTSGVEGSPIACTHAEKATLLADRFFPDSVADLTDVTDTTFGRDTFPADPLVLPQTVTADDVEQTLRYTGAWKAPGDDGLPVGFLRACGPPLYHTLAAIATASFQVGYFPTCCKTAKVVVIQKPGKPPEARQTPGGWRPISLLSTVGKVLEAIIGARIASAAEDHNVLPEGQMGNRRGRSTETAIRMVTATVQEAWRHGGVASLLQLDIKGAFDTVNYTRLLDTLRKQRFPHWLVQWVRSYITGRTAVLQFDGQPSKPVTLRAGVPQGSPLSPILFLLYITPLYEALATHQRLLVVGFADDSNLLAFGNSDADTCPQLEDAWRTCTQWAATRGMSFAPQKSELIHFTRARAPLRRGVCLGESVVEPVESARFLGVWLDRKLRWGKHLEKLKQKMATQTFALTRIGASAWGCRLRSAREVYTKVIRSALAYGASAFHTPTPLGGRPKGAAKSLNSVQTKCLRTVTGAYRATPARSLETEAVVPPLDLYLNKRVADFEARLEASGMATKIQAACTAVRIRLRQRRRGRPPEAPPPPWAMAWLQTGTSEEGVEREWRLRFQSEVAAVQRRHPRRLLEPADADPGFSPKTLKRYSDLRKHESSLLVQARTGKIGLRAFLFQRQVPDVATPLCQCGEGRETAEHVVCYCLRWREQRAALEGRLGRALRTRRDFHTALSDAKEAGVVIRWLLSTGRIQEFRLARRLYTREEQGEERDPGG
jgi:hypothetical protein